MIMHIIFDSKYTLQDKFIMIVSYLIVIYFAIVLHEIGHAVVAYWNGDMTAKTMGRFSLNPLKHFEPMGLVMFIIVSMGWAKPVPINPYNFKNEKAGLVTVALAGVTVNLILSFFFFGLYVGMGALAQKLTIDAESFWVILIKFGVYIGLYGAIINISLIAFNLLPIYPLDGFRLVEAFTMPTNKYVLFMRKYSLYFFLVLIGLGFVQSITGLPVDVLGMYLNAIQSLIIKLYSLILGV